MADLITIIALDQYGLATEHEVSVEIEGTSSTDEWPTNYAFPSTSLGNSTFPLTAVTTFHNASLYWNEPQSGDAYVRFRKLGTTNWRQGLSLWFDTRTDARLGARAQEYRGSLVDLDPDTTYEVQVQTATSRRRATVQFTTWSETFAVANTTYITSQSTPLEITQSGTAGAYRLYTVSPGASGLIDVAKAYDYCVNVASNVHHVIIRGLTLKGGFLVGIKLSQNCNNIIIEDNDIYDFGRSDPAITQYAANNCAGIRTMPTGTANPSTVRLVIQNNRIHNPTYDANSWLEYRVDSPGYGPSSPYNHPAGACGIELMETGGNHVIRYNIFYSDLTHMFKDLIGGAKNFSQNGGLYRDCDIYGNDFSHCWDDGVETDGAGQNVRVYENRFSYVYVCVSSSCADLGPVYVFRNVATKTIRDSTEMSDIGIFWKNRNSDVGDSVILYGGYARVYLLHNTLYCTGTTDRVAAAISYQNNEILTRHVWTRNNIWQTRYGPGGDWLPRDGVSCDYDLYDASHQSNGWEEVNGVQGLPVYESTHTSGTYTLASASPGRNAAVSLPNFNDRYVTPDIGAQERGAVALEFGTRSQAPQVSPTLWPTQGAVSYTPIVRGLRANGADCVGGSGRAYGVNYTVGQQAPTAVTIRRVTGATDAARGASFVAALNAHNTGTGPSLIVFDTSGAMDLAQASTRVRRGQLTIAGQTAPNPGVYYYNGKLLVYPNGTAVYDITMTDVLIQHLMGFGEAGIGEGLDTFEIYGAAGNISRVVVDHCAFMWGGDSQGDVGSVPPYYVTNIVYSHTMMGEGVPIAPLLGGAPRGYIVESTVNQFTSYGCYVWNIQQRAPRMRGHAGQFYNNLYYNYAYDNGNSIYGRCVSFDSTDSGSYLGQVNLFDLENNAFIRKDSRFPNPIHDGIAMETTGCSVHVAGNNLWNGLTSANTPQTSVGQWGLVRSAPGVAQAAARQNYPTGLVLASATQTKDNVVAYVGPRPRYRDTNLQRIFGELASNTGTLKETIPGYPTYTVNTTTFPASPTTGTWRDIVACSDGYNRTRLEKYLQDLEDALLPQTQGVQTVTVNRVFDEPYPSESVEFPSTYQNYQLMRPRISHLTYPDVLPPDFEGFNVASNCTVYVWSIAPVTKIGWSAVLSGGVQVTATGSLGNVWRLYSRSQTAGAVATWGANGVDAINGNITNLPPLFMVPQGIAITNTPIPYSWQTIGSSTSPSTADKRSDYIDARYWNADTLSLTPPANATVCSTVAALVTAVTTGTATSIVWDNVNATGADQTSGMITKTIDVTRSGTWAAPISIYVSDPNRAALTTTGYIHVLGKHVRVIGWASTGATLAGTTKYVNSVFATAEDADWCVFVQCSVISPAAIRDGNGDVNHYSADFYCQGRMTGVIRCFGDVTRPNVAQHNDSFWCNGRSKGEEGQSYAPCPIVYRSWWKGNALNTTSNEGGPTPIQFGENNAYGTDNPNEAVFADLATNYGQTRFYYGDYWTGGLVFRTLLEECYAGIELTTNKHHGNAFVQNRILTCAGQHGNRNGGYHAFIGEWIDQRRGDPAVTQGATAQKRGGYRLHGTKNLVLNAVISKTFGGTNANMGAGSGTFYLASGNHEYRNIADSNLYPASYTEAENSLIVNCSIIDPEINTSDGMFAWNETGSGSTTYYNFNLYVVNCVAASTSEPLNTYALSIPTNTIKMANNVFQYNLTGNNNGNIVGVPAVTVPAWTESPDRLYRPTTTGNLTGAKSLTVKFPDMEGKPMAGYKGALASGVGAGHPVLKTTGTGRYAGPASTLLNVFESAPPFPRLGGRFQSALDEGLSSGELATQAALLSKQHVLLLSPPRTRTWAAGAYNVTTIAAYIRSQGEPYAGYKTVCALYTNPIQFDDNLTYIGTKCAAESGVGGNSDWYLRMAPTEANPEGEIVVGSSSGKSRPNTNQATTPDSSTSAPFASGMRYGQWLARTWAGASTESGDWARPGAGICETGSEWYAAYSDEVNIADSFSNPTNADWNNDGVDESRTSTEIKNIVVASHVAYATAWRSLFTHYSMSGRYMLGNLSSPSAQAQPWISYTSLQNLYNGGLAERVSSYEQALGFGDYTTATSGGDTGSGFMGRYWRSMRYCANPKLVMFENDIDDVKSKAWAAPETSFNDYRWMRYYLAACLMDDGYYGVKQTGVTIPWFDEYDGGVGVRATGWLGWPVNSTPPRAAWNQGVWLREFTNGLVVLNPYQNGNKTVTLPSAGTGFKWKRINGTQDSTVNNGVDQVSSLTISDHDALILRRVAI